MIELSRSETAAVYGAVIPNFRPDAHGRHRGPASYRDGNNATALAVDTKQLVVGGAVVLGLVTKSDHRTGFFNAEFTNYLLLIFFLVAVGFGWGALV